ncbi:hypothetical protein JIX56_11930 [Streptomyces sp. CA-210063]|nr:hypothetical protein [Streptomyces sp. CA-210063]UUU30557.1 hypothetical protein JIX56_11930 [Streptomyces sp. CA-210063]
MHTPQASHRSLLAGTAAAAAVTALHPALAHLATNGRGIQYGEPV